jgi:hypothetical protein
MNNYPGLLSHLLRLSLGNYSGLFKANFLSCIVKEITVARRKQLHRNAKAIP